MIRDIPKIYQANYNKAMKGKSKAAAIKAFCLECVGWQKEEVKLCTDINCSLYPYRPFKSLNCKGYLEQESTNAS